MELRDRAVSVVALHEAPVPHKGPAHNLCLGTETRQNIGWATLGARTQLWRFRGTGWEAAFGQRWRSTGLFWGIGVIAQGLQPILRTNPPTHRADQGDFQTGGVP